MDGQNGGYPTTPAMSYPYDMSYVVPPPSNILILFDLYFALSNDLNERISSSEGGREARKLNSAVATDRTEQSKPHNKAGCKAADILKLNL